jgi:uncharacterized protein YecT (DUF1311 family)
MQKKFLILSLALLLSTSASASIEELLKTDRAQYTCNPKDHTTIGMTFCNIHLFFKWHDALTKVYNIAEKDCEYYQETEPQRVKICKDKLAKAQKSWYQFINDQSSYLGYGDGTITQIIVSNFLYKETKEQTYRLIPMDAPEISEEIKQLEEYSKKITE